MMTDKYMVVLYKKDHMFWRRIGAAPSNEDGTKQDWPALEAMNARIAEQEKELDGLRDRECNACDWTGRGYDCVWLGAMGPLCPECNETTVLSNKK